MIQHMHGNIPYMFDCWADPVVHLLLLKSSMAEAIGYTDKEIDMKKTGR